MQARAFSEGTSGRKTVVLKAEVRPMETIYWVCFLVGGTLLICQFLLSLTGLGGHHDVGGHDADATGHDAHVPSHHPDTHDTQHGVASWFVGMLTFRTLVAALTFFGVVGLAGTQQWGEEPRTFAVALAAGAAAFFLVGSLMRWLSRLRAEGTVRMERAVGRSGTVYLPIPGRKAGLGKVTLNLQNRTVECQAVTADQDLPTGAQVVVVAVIGPDTVEVAPLTPGGA
jgi:hypothetical protein